MENDEMNDEEHVVIRMTLHAPPFLYQFSAQYKKKMIINEVRNAINARTEEKVRALKAQATRT